MSQVYRALEKAERERNSAVEPLTEIFEVEQSITVKQRKSVTIERKPAVPGATDDDFWSYLAPPNSYSAEQFRRLKIHIFRRTPRPPRSILVTSCAPQEGKTLVSFNLAMAISQETNKKSIFIDADLRRSSIFLKSKDRMGLVEYLQGQSSIEEIMASNGSGSFQIIPAGSPSQRAPELINSSKMEELLRHLRGQEENTYVVIDSPPLLLTSEALLLAEWVDGVVLVVRAGQVSKGDVRKVVDTIGRKKIIGIVFNRKDLKPLANDALYPYSG